MIRLSIGTYNSLYSYQPGTHFIFGQQVLIEPRLFTDHGKKSPKFVRKENPGWQRILSHKETLEQLILFLGKYESGSEEIIYRVAEDFSDKKEVPLFILCPHELEEKRALLRKLGFPEDRWKEFNDYIHPCLESPLLMGYAIDFLFKNPRL
jgi:hypothetical protein